MSSLILWRRGSRSALIRAIQAEAPLPPYVPGRGLGRDVAKHWPLPPLSETNVPLFIKAEAPAALVSLYEEYVDRYLDTHDYEVPPRTWLHANIPADLGVLEYVFPILKGSAQDFAAEVYLIRLVWLIQRCPGMVPQTTSTEILVNTTVGTIGIRPHAMESRCVGSKVLYRFKPEGIPLVHNPVISQALAVGHSRVFSIPMNRLYHHLSESGRQALTLLGMRIRTKELMRLLYDDGLVTGGCLSGIKRTDDKLLRMEFAVTRSQTPVDTLQQMLVPEYLGDKEFRFLFNIPWKMKDRNRIDSNYLIRKMPLVRKILEMA